MSACYDGNVQQVRVLLAYASVDPSYDDSVALRVAVGNRREEVVRVLYSRYSLPRSASYTSRLPPC
jgi:hypothetical protein